MSGRRGRRAAAKEDGGEDWAKREAEDLFRELLDAAEIRLVAIEDVRCRRMAATYLANWMRGEHEVYFDVYEPAAALVRLFREDFEKIRDAACRAYRAGEIDLRELLRVTSACAKFVDNNYQDEFVAYAVEWALTIEPKRLNRSRPPVPDFMKGVAVAILKWLVRDCVDRPLAPMPEHPSGSPLLAAALRLLEEMGLVQRGRIKPKTLYRWYRERQGNAEASARPASCHTSTNVKSLPHFVLRGSILPSSRCV